MHNDLSFILYPLTVFIRLLLVALALALAILLENLSNKNRATYKVALFICLNKKEPCGSLLISNKLISQSSKVCV